MIKLLECTKIYPNGTLGIDKVNLMLPTTGLIGVLGKSGSGKSTLINCLGGLDRFSTGEIYINHVRVDNLNDYSSYIFQEFKLFEDLSVAQNIIFSLEIDEILLDELLYSLGILDIKDSKVKLISGGQRQRVAIARALVRNDSIIFCDEPTASLDDQTSREIMNIFRRIGKEKLVIVVSHNEKLIKQYTNELIYVNEGTVTSNFTPAVDNHNLKKSDKSPKLFNKDAIKFSINNMFHNKIKSVLTTFFLWLSLTIVFLLIGIITIDVNKISYNSYKENEMPYVEFVKYENDNPNGTLQNTPSNIVSKFDNGIIRYSEINFNFQFNDKTYHVHNIWVVDNEFKGYQLKDNEILISPDIIQDIMDYQISNNRTLFLPKLELTIKDILSSMFEDVIILNNETFAAVNSNLYEPSSITFEATKEGAYTNTPIFNPYYSYNQIDLLEGYIPNDKGEAAVPIQIVNHLYHDIDPKELIGEYIEVNFLPNQLNLYSGDDKVLVIKERLLVTGLTNQGFIFSDEDLNYFTSTYGSERLDNGLQSLLVYNYKLNTFKVGYNNRLYHMSDLSHKLYLVYSIFDNITVYLIVILTVFLILAIITIMNSVSTSILKSKKELGILISFKIQKKSLNKIFLIENFIFLFISGILSIATFIFLFNYLNFIINNEFKINVDTIQFNFSLILISIIVYIFILNLSVKIPLRKLVKKDPIDILFER